MAEHDGAAAQAQSAAAESVDADELDAEAAAKPGPKKRVPEWVSSIPKPAAVGVAIILALIGLAGWLGYRVHQDHQAQAQRNLYLQVARQTAVNLTTIDYTGVDADIKRVLDSATGGFSRRVPEEVAAVRRGREEGAVEIARARWPRRGCCPRPKDQAQVLVAVSVKTSMGAAPADRSRADGGCALACREDGRWPAKVSNVEFVP